jgi:hypothetical protein
MKFFLLRPEVPGRVGAQTELDTSVHPPRVISDVVVLELDDWLGSSLVKCYPCFFVTKELAKRIRDAGFTGCAFRPTEVTKSPTFEDLYPAGRYIPEFEELNVSGLAGKDDFGKSRENKLVASERALQLIKEHGVHECEVEPYFP